MVCTSLVEAFVQDGGTLAFFSYISFDYRYDTRGPHVNRN